ncbi:MAG TPA: CopG family transcriptional regulator [Deltaproteobacteria bacterium]|nr:MAG: hypothetical protein DRG37_03245 [Deltaproteobacteria bacterium]HDM32230.1 CopG family transcriptional regulator [Deltaproteobacteria bacterium]
MRLTVHIDDNLADLLKRTAMEGHQSVSSLVAQAVEYYLVQKRRKELGGRVLEIVGKAYVSSDALELIEKGRGSDRT